MRFSNKELKDLAAAWFIISLAFAILFSPDFSNFAVFFGISAFTVGVGFVFHELMHKFAAQNFGLWAEFRADYIMLILALGLSFAGFIIAAPGAVMIHGATTKSKEGKISLIGPVTNLGLAVIFLVPLLALSVSGLAGLFFNIGFRINALLAAFNLIPFGVFDGKKIYDWSKETYFVIVAVAVGLFVLSYLV